MTVWQRLRLFLRRPSKAERVEWAYGLWLSSPRTTNASTFISNVTGIPRNQVWGIIYGKKNNHE